MRILKIFNQGSFFKSFGVTFHDQGEYLEVEVALFEIMLSCFREAFLGRPFKIKVLFIDRDFYDQGSLFRFRPFS